MARHPAARWRPGCRKKGPRLARGRRECRVSVAPAASRAKGRYTSIIHHRSSGFTPAFPARRFYALSRALLGVPGLIAPSRALIATRLTPASGCQDHTTLPSAGSRVRLARSLASIAFRFPRPWRWRYAPLC